jgi:hypothetical protein
MRRMVGSVRGRALMVKTGSEHRLLTELLQRQERKLPTNMRQG